MKKFFLGGNIYVLVVMVLLITALSVFAIIYRGWVQALEGYGYLGLFFLNILAAATVIVPIPAIVAVFAMGGILNPLLVGAVAGIGEGIGGLSAYFLGHSGRMGFNNFHNSLNGNKRYRSIYSWIEKRLKNRWALTIFVSSAIPNPFFLPMGAASALAQFPFWKFFMCCWIGKTVKGIVIAGLGALGLRAIFHIFGIPV
jgi:membrane protein YqaA with SNARE-associated domain